MFLAISLHPDDTHQRVDDAAVWHTAKLSETGRFSTLASRRIAGGSVYWDAGSDHAALFERPDGAAFLVRGGYIAADDVWGPDGSHATDSNGTWGEFATVRVDESAQTSRVRVYADQAGSWPLYYGRRGANAVVSNDPQFVAVALGFDRLSTQGAYELLAYYHRIGDETTIAGVYGVPARSEARLSATSAGVQALDFAQRVTLSFPSPMSDDAASTAAYRELVAGTRTIPPLAGDDAGIIFSVSGGLDSRLTLGAFAEASEARPEVLTLALSDDDEVGIARDVSTTLGFPHRVAVLGGLSIEDAKDGWLLTGGQVSVFAAADNLPSYDAASTAVASHITLVGAWPGDCLIGSYVPYNRLFVAPWAKRWALRDWTKKREALWDRRGVVASGSALKATARRARKSIRRQLKGVGGATAAQSVSRWAMFERQQRFSYVSPAILSHNVLAVTPVLAPGYVEVLVGLTGRQIMSKNFYRRMIVEKLPALRDIPYANTQAVITEEQFLPDWLPRHRSLQFDMLPLFAQNLVRRLRPGNHTVYIGETDETAHWRRQFAEAGAEASVELDGITVDATELGDIHVISVGLALKWTREHLEEAIRVLGPARA